MYWATSDGLAHTRRWTRTGLFNYSAWSWCGQQSDNPKATVNQYLSALNTLEGQVPGVRFVYLTGHTEVITRASCETTRWCAITSWPTAKSCLILPGLKATTRRGMTMATMATGAPGATSGAATIPPTALIYPKIVPIPTVCNAG